MARKSKSKSSSKKGYGLHNVEKRIFTNKDINLLLKKRWKDISSMDLTKLIQLGKKTEEIAKHYNTSTLDVLNRIRFL